MEEWRVSGELCETRWALGKGMESVFAIGAVDANQIPVGETFDEPATVGLLDNAGIQKRHNTLIRGGTDEASDALAKFDQGLRQREFGEGVAALIANPLGACFERRMCGDLEGQTGHDDLGECGAGDIDAGPKTIGAEQDGIAALTHFID